MNNIKKMSKQYVNKFQNLCQDMLGVIAEREVMHTLQNYLIQVNMKKKGSCDEEI